VCYVWREDQHFLQFGDFHVFVPSPTPPSGRKREKGQLEQDWKATSQHRWKGKPTLSVFFFSAPLSLEKRKAVCVWQSVVVRGRRPAFINFHPSEGVIMT